MYYLKIFFTNNIFSQKLRNTWPMPEIFVNNLRLARSNYLVFAFRLKMQLSPKEYFKFASDKTSFA